MDWSRLLSPLSPEDFAENHWERLPGRIGAARSERAALLTVDTLDRILAEGNVPAELVSFNLRGEPTKLSYYSDEHIIGKGRRIRSLDLERAYQLLSRGHTMVVAELQRRHVPIASLCASMAELLEGRVNANAYLTPPRHQGFGPHWDSHDVFIVQLHGQKRWRLFGAPHPLPLSEETFDRLAPNVGAPQQELVLEPGDLLYVPRGHIHEAAALDTLSLHVTIGVTVPRATDLISEMLLIAAHEDVEFRRALPPDFILGGSHPAARDNAMRRVLRRLLNPDRLTRARLDLGTRFAPPASPRFRQRLTSLAKTSELDIDSVFGAVPGLRVSRSPSRGTVELRDGSRALVLPEVLTEELDFIAGASAFRVRDLPGVLEDEDKLALTTRLVRDGFLQFRGDSEARA